MELSFLGTFVPWNFRSRERMFHGTFAPYQTVNQLLLQQFYVKVYSRCNILLLHVVALHVACFMFYCSCNNRLTLIDCLIIYMYMF